MPYNSQYRAIIPKVCRSWRSVRIRPFSMRLNEYAVSDADGQQLSNLTFCETGPRAVLTFTMWEENN